MKLMIPFTPHISYEILEKLKCKNSNNWPEINENLIENIKIAVQINGKTRDILNVNKGLLESDLKKIVMLQSKAKKYIKEANIKKIIFVQNKIINYIIPNS